MVAMWTRKLAAGHAGRRLLDRAYRFNSRHPWSHNDAFHPWILSRLPDQREHALDVGCGRGGLIAALAAHFNYATGLDPNADMRHAADQYCAGLTNVTVSGASFDAAPGPVDLVTMVAVLHHLDVDSALTQVRNILRPGGKFLCVGLARPVTPVDHAWELASTVTNPLIGYVRHPWASTAPPIAPIPTRDPELSIGQLRDATSRLIPGATLKRHLGFRHTIEWEASR